MIKVCALTDATRKGFEKLFADYYEELDCGENVEHLLNEYILADCLAGLIKIDVIFEGETLAGFVIYQIDDINNEWNLKEGWGDVREIYISPSFRRQGLGKFLLYSAEMKLKEAGAKKSYCLPYEAAVPFFTACGYKDTLEYCEDLDCNIFAKISLENCECKK